MRVSGRSGLFFMRLSPHPRSAGVFRYAEDGSDIGGLRAADAGSRRENPGGLDGPVFTFGLLLSCHFPSGNKP
jgi:hypothetical protein